MVICVKCANAITTKKIKKAEWERIEGRWYCPVCKMNVSNIKK